MRRKREELSLVTASHLVTEAWTATLYRVRLYTEKRRGQRGAARVEGAERQRVREKTQKIPSGTKLTDTNTHDIQTCVLRKTRLMSYISKYDPLDAVPLLKYSTPYSLPSF